MTRIEPLNISMTAFAYILWTIIFSFKFINFDPPIIYDLCHKSSDLGKKPQNTRLTNYRHIDSTIRAERPITLRNIEATA